MNNCDLLEPRQRKYAELIASGVPEREALLSSGFPESHPSFRLFPAIMKNNPAVQALIAELKKTYSLESMSKAEAVDILTRIVRSKPTEASFHNPLCNVVNGSPHPSAEFPDKVACLDLLSRLLGWQTPSEGIHNVIIEGGGEILENQSNQGSSL